MCKMFTVETAISNYFQGTISKSKLYKMVENNEIPHSRVGTRILLRQDSLDRWMREREQGGGETA